MITISDMLNIGSITILHLSAELPATAWSKVVIDGAKYEAEPVYDMPKSVGVRAAGDFIGKRIEFI